MVLRRDAQLQQQEMGMAMPAPEKNLDSPQNKKYRKRSFLTLRDLVMVGLGLSLFTLLSVFNNGDFGYERSSSRRTSLVTNDEDKGWHAINVFYGKEDHLWNPVPPNKFWVPKKFLPSGSSNIDTTSPKMWFSQHGQDVAVAKVLDFKRTGFFVDLAANDAIWASNTVVLEQHFGWDGICIEGNQYYWNRLAYRKCHAVAAMAGASDFEEVEVSLGQSRESGPFGGIVGSHFDNKTGKKNGENEKRYTVRLSTILRKFGAPKVIEYLSLDVEGAETYILRNFDWDQYTFLCLTVERPSEELQGILNKNGYRKVMDIKRGDTLWVHKSMYEQAKKNLAVKPDEINMHIVAGYPPNSHQEASRV